MTLRQCKTVLVAVLFGFAATAHGGLSNPFFAMDTGTKDKDHQTFEQQAALLAGLGYDGYGYTGFEDLGGLLAALDAKGLKLFNTYTGVTVDADGKAQYDEALVGSLPLFKGRDVVLWIPMNVKGFESSDPAGDDKAVVALHEIADLAAPHGVRLALYPHANMWLETVGDALRVAEKVDRPNVGATFNLCHWLSVEGAGSDLLARLQRALPFLFFVTINGADTEGGWDRLIQTLARGSFEVATLVQHLADLGYTGPVGLQGYGIGGDVADNLKRSMGAWKELSTKADDDWQSFLGGDFGAFHDPIGEWETAGAVCIHPDDRKLLTWAAGTAAVVNGKTGRTKHLVTRHKHGDIEAHVELMVPEGSNSGVYFQGRYEIQVLDSWGVKTPKHSDCSGIYQRWDDAREGDKGYEGHPPRVSAARRPGQWQSFDVVFRAPRFDEKGRKVRAAEFVRVLHNGVVVHENQVLSGPTRSSLFNDEKPLGPLMFQGDHGPVAYRNIRVRPLAADSPGGSGEEEAGGDAYTVLLTYEFGQSRAALTAIEQELSGASPEAQAVIEAKLLGVVQSGEATHAAKQFACKMLARVASAKAIPVLSPLLLDEKLSHMARYALETLPEPQVDAALLHALKSSAGNVSAGLINSLGERRTQGAVETLAALLNNEDAAVAQASAAALGKIGSDAAGRVLARSLATGSGNAGLAVAEAVLRCGNQFLAEGKEPQGLSMLQTLYEMDLPAALHAAAFQAIATARGEVAAPLVADAYAREEGEMAQVALGLIRTLPGADATRAFTLLLSSLDASKKVPLLDALAARRDYLARDGVLATLTDEEGEVRLAALRALGVLGSPATVPALLKFATANKGKTRMAAREALARLSVADVNGALVKQLREGPEEVRGECIRALVARRAEDSVPAFIDAAQAGSASLKPQALEALGVLAPPSALQQVAGLWASADSEAQSAADKALAAVALREGDEKQRWAAISPALPEEPTTAQRCSLARVAGKIGDDVALEHLRGFLGEDADVQMAAIRALADWSTPAPLPELKAMVAEGDSEVHRVLAMRGCVRLLGLPSERTPEETVALYIEALELAARPEEKKQVLAGLAQVPAPAALEPMLACLDDEALRSEALIGALQLGEALMESHPALVKEELAPLVQQEENADVAKKAAELMKAAE